MKKICFLTGTRADFSKLKPLISVIQGQKKFDVGIFITGMHMLAQYGSTHLEIEKVSDWDYKYINQSYTDSDTAIVAKTISAFGDFISENRPDLIVVHGDRLEALAGACVGAMTNTLVAHIEGGELSGTVDDSYRHAISKLSHMHFVANQEAYNRLLQLGEDSSSIFVIGSPELDLAHSTDLPSIQQVLQRYEIPFENYAIAILHPVVTEIEIASSQASILFQALIESNKKFVLIESNNDRGSNSIRNEINKLKNNSNFKVLPSMRYEYFLVLLKSTKFIIGNSSTGIREAPHYGVPTINVGSRQNGRSSSPSIKNVDFEVSEILKAIENTKNMSRNPEHYFGDGMSAHRFSNLINSSAIWNTSIQKRFHIRSANEPE